MSPLRVEEGFRVLTLTARVDGGEVLEFIRRYQPWHPTCTGLGGLG
ncbi:hypothetical protein [Vulcanisaeta souniana]|nr:hypothetical protein [Vulcanisaeta souniana]